MTESIMTESEKTFERLLRESGISPRFEDGPNKSPKPDFIFDIGGQNVFAEVKEVRPNRLDKRISLGQQRGWWGAREGEQVIRSSGRLDHTGWGGHFLKAISQLETASRSNHQTLIVFQSFSLSADLDSTDIALFLFGYHYEIVDGQMSVVAGNWDDRTPPMISYDGFENVSGLAYIRNEQFCIYANPFARVQLTSELFDGLDRCQAVLELDEQTRFHGDWVRWTSDFNRLNGRIVNCS